MASHNRRRVKNPLIDPSPLPHGAPVLDKIRPQHFLPAYQQTMLDAQREVVRIANNPEPPTFENTIEALEWPVDYHTQTENLLQVYAAEIKPGALKNISGRINALETKFKYSLYHNMNLFERIKALRENTEKDLMTEAQVRLIAHHYDKFRERGAHLPDKDRRRLKTIATRMSNLQAEYTANAQKNTGQKLADLNIPLAHNILRLRHQEAQLLGHKTYADFAISKNEAGTTDNVLKMLEEYYSGLKQLYKDYPDLSQSAQKKALAVPTTTNPEEKIETYFPIDQVLDGLIRHAEKFFDIRFVKTENKYRVHHPGVRAYEIHNNENDAILGLYFGDFYTYEGQTREGAAAYELRSRSVRNGLTYIPIVMKCCTFDAPINDQAPLLSLDEVTYLFHEMGHALQMVLTTGKHPSLSGANTKLDVCEIPSQLQEEWVLRKDILRSIGRHYITGARIPEEELDSMIDKIARDRIENMMEQCYHAILDISLHNRDPKTIKDIPAFENEIRQEMGLHLLTRENTTCANFWHMFGLDTAYGARVNMYQWSGIRAADIYREYLKKEEEGSAACMDFAKAVRNKIYTEGGNRSGDDLFRELMGRDPDIQAVFDVAARGLIKKQQAAPAIDNPHPPINNPAAPAQPLVLA